MSLSKKKKLITNIIVLSVAFVAIVLIAILVNNHHPLCAVCEGTGLVDEETCTPCNGDGIVDNRYFGTFVALLPPIIAIVLALITKEVYSSLFMGILSGALFNGEFKFANSWDTITTNGFIASCGDSWNAGILIFMVILGIIVALVNKAGGARAFGDWTKTHIKSRVGAQLATFALGVIIFIDDYFNCLTVGSVMRPLTDKKKISREKLAYIIDATAAPVCMIAPISSWAAAVSSTAADLDMNGIMLFCNAIAYNYYSILTLVFIITLSILRIEFGPMKKFEQAAQMLDDATPIQDSEVDNTKKSRVIDLIAPIVSLIVLCVVGMIYSGGFFDASSDNHLSLINSFAGSDASVGLVWGSMISLIFTIIYFIARRLLAFKDSMDCIKSGFIAMVPAILILCFAWTLNGITGMLGADVFVAGKMQNAAQGLKNMLPAIIFVVALGLAFSTGTSWGTFGILIPIVVAVFGANGGELLTIGISACLAGAVCGDHCSPISDTTIMASAGAECNHINHVSTQLPYALTVAAISFIMFILAGFIQVWSICLAIGIALTVGVLFAIKYILKSIEQNKTNAYYNTQE